MTFGIAAEVASDGGPQFIAHELREFFSQYGVHHRMASAYMPHSNQLAEGGVKIAKRMIRENTGRSGTLDTDAFLAAKLAYLNTPDRHTKLSPAQVVFGRATKELLPETRGNYIVHPEWRTIKHQREEAMARTYQARKETLNEHTKTLRPLAIGATVAVQNQSGNHPKVWGRSGLVVEVKQHDQYVVKMDGSGRISLRNRRFLRQTQPDTNKAPGPSPTAAQKPAVPIPAGTADRPPTYAEAATGSQVPQRRSTRTSRAPARWTPELAGLKPTPTYNLGITGPGRA